MEVQREGSTALVGHGQRPDDLYFAPTFTLPGGKAFRGHRRTSTFYVGVATDRLVIGRIRGKNGGKTTSTFYHDERFHRTGVLKSSSIWLERGTGLEPATSTLGKLRSAD